MATDENKIQNVVHDEVTRCTFRVERGPNSEGRAGGMADILTKAFAGHGGDHWYNVVESRAGGAFAEVFFRRPSHFYELRARLSRYESDHTTASALRRSGRRASRATSWASSR